MISEPPTTPNGKPYNTIGMVEDVLFVVYTERKDRLRIISARLANKKERSMYYERYL